MITFTFSKLHLKKNMLFLLFSSFQITTHTMLPPLKNLTASITRQIIVRNLDKFNTMSIAAFSSKNNFDSKNSKTNKLEIAGILGTLGVSTIAIHRDNQKNTELNELIYELQNDKTINQEIENETTVTKRSKPSAYSLFNTNFFNTTVLHMAGALDNKSSDEIKAINELFQAIENGTCEDIQCCLNKGTNINSKNRSGETPLHWAIINDKKDSANFLIDAGAELNAADKSGRTPLHEAAKRGDIKIIEFLIQHKANLNAVDEYGWTPLHMAIGNGNIENIEYLIRAGADINAKSTTGDTPLHLACEWGKTDIIETLIKHGADRTAEDINGATPYHLMMPICNQIDQKTIDLLIPSTTSDTSKIN